MNLLFRKGQQGIGVIISFIMVVLVVSIAASVITSTSSSLESVSNDVTKDTKKTISSSVEVAQIYIEKGSSIGEFVSGVANVSAVLRLRAGSDASRIDDILLQFGTPASSQALYSSGDSTYDGASFGYEYLIQGGKFQNGYVNEGDVVELKFTFQGSTNIQEGDNLLLNLVHIDGGVVPIVFTAPRSLIADVVYLYP